MAGKERLDPGPGAPRRRRRATDVFVGAWLVFHVAVPLGYYTVRDREDERFAWRMYSAQRAEICRVDFTERTEGGKAKKIDLKRAIHSGWESALERGRPDVVEAFVRKRCEGGAARVDLLRRCKAGDGKPLEPERKAWRCPDLAPIDLETSGRATLPAPLPAPLPAEVP